MTEVSRRAALADLEELPRGERPERLLIVGATSDGQLANRLLLFSHLAALAEERGHVVVHPAFAPYAELFAGTAGSLFCRYPADDAFFASPAVPVFAQLFFEADRAAREVFGARGPSARELDLLSSADWRERLERFCASVTDALGRRAPNPSSPLRHMRVPFMEEMHFDGIDLLDGVGAYALLFLDGWGFRAVGAQQRHAAALRRFFTPAARFLPRIAELAGAARGDADVLAGIHIRHGDYRLFQDGRFFFPLDVYVRVMRELRDLLAPRRVRFLVCSDEPQSAAAFDGLDVAFGSGVAVEDLYALARADVVVGPMSTFSYWASFYGGIPLQWLMDAQWRPTAEWAASLRLLR